MFSTLANFLFGVSKPNLDDVQETEYKTHEDEDDWLLVNVSDRETGDNKEVVEKDTAVQEEDPMDEENDVLASIPLLFSSSAENSLVVSCSRNTDLRSKNFSKSKFCMDKYNLIAIMPSVFVPSYWLTGYPFAHKYPTNSPIYPEPDKNLIPLDLLKKPQSSLTVATIAGKRGNTSKQHKLYSLKTKYDKLDKSQMTCAFINQQSPILLTKTELLQKIKEQRPIQQAREHELNKHLNKSQLTRHNKAYFYASSNKNQHRRDLWVRHSGANNNRKCC